MANKLDLAEAQILGFHHGYHGFTLKSLIESMGMTKSEWKKLKYAGRVQYLSDNEQLEIDEYFGIYNH